MLQGVGRPDEVEAHFAMLEARYAAVGDRTWNGNDFAEQDLRNSRDLFTDESLQLRRPRPKELEVYALLSGLPFAPDFVEALVRVQRRISGVLEDRLHYWVAPDNLGVEYCVFKWPNETVAEESLNEARRALAAMKVPAFDYSIGGIQINPDGCVVARGYDGGAAMFEVRSRLRSALPFMPQRQSEWAHVPLGRILEPVGSDRFARLRDLINSLSQQEVARTRLGSMLLIHETRWYMEERRLLEAYPLSGAVGHDARIRTDL